MYLPLRLMSDVLTVSSIERTYMDAGREDLHTASFRGIVSESIKQSEFKDASY